MSGVVTEILQNECSYSDEEKQRIRAHLDELLGSDHFAGSRRRQAFLRYVVEESLAARGANIKETSIAVDVFGKSRDFASQDSSIVRVTGGDVRKRLAQAYSTGLGHDVRIELKAGCYQPSFHFPNHTTEALDVSAHDVAEPISEPASIRTPEKTNLRRRWLAAAVVIVAGCLITAGSFVQLRGMFRPSPALDQLWRPFLDKDRPVLISIATPVLLKINPLHQNQFLPLDEAASIPASELVVLRDSYVGTGGAMGAARFAEQLTRRKQGFDLKFGSDADFADLKNSPSILIGVSALSQRLTQGARFQMQIFAEGIRITDSKDKNRVWERPRRNFASPPRTDGYSLITRLSHSGSGHPVLMIAGMDSHNTQAAVEFLTRNESFRQFADSAPSNWPNRSFQIVLHNAIYGNSAGSLTVVASEIW